MTKKAIYNWVAGVSLVCMVAGLAGCQSSQKEEQPTKKVGTSEKESTTKESTEQKASLEDKNANVGTEKSEPVEMSEEVQRASSQDDTFVVLTLVLESAQKKDIKTIQSLYGKEMKDAYEAFKGMVSEKQMNESLVAQYDVLKGVAPTDFVKTEKDGIVSYRYDVKGTNTYSSYEFAFAKEDGQWKLNNEGLTSFEVADGVEMMPATDEDMTPLASQ